MSPGDSNTLLNAILGKRAPVRRPASEWDQYELENSPPLPSVAGVPDNAPDPAGPLWDRHLSLFMDGVRPDLYKQPVVPDPGHPGFQEHYARAPQGSIAQAYDDYTFNPRRPTPDTWTIDEPAAPMLGAGQSASPERSPFGFMDSPGVRSDSIDSSAIARANTLADRASSWDAASGGVPGFGRAASRPQTPFTSHINENSPAVPEPPAPVTGEFGRTGQYLAGQGGVGGFRGADLQVGTPMEIATKQMRIRDQVRSPLAAPEIGTWTNNGVRSIGTRADQVNDMISRQRSAEQIAAGDAMVRSSNDMVSQAANDVSHQELANNMLLDGIRTGATAERQLRQADMNAGINRDGQNIPAGWAPGAPLTQRLAGPNPVRTPNPVKYYADDDGLPGGKVAFGKMMPPTAKRLTEEMGRFGAAQDAQRERLIARGESPERIAQLMGGPRQGPDFSRLVAVSNNLQRNAGLNPRLAMGMATMGDPAFANRELLSGLLGVQTDPMAQENLRGAKIQNDIAAAEAERKAADIRDPQAAAQRDVDIQNAKREAAARGAAGDITSNVLAVPESLTLYGNEYLNGGQLEPRVAAALRDDYESDLYDNHRSSGNPLNWLAGKGGWTDRGDEDIFVEHVERKYPGFPPEAARKFYRQHLGSALYRHVQNPNFGNP